MAGTQDGRRQQAQVTQYRHHEVTQYRHHRMTQYRQWDLQAPVAKQYKRLLFVGDPDLGEGRRTAGPAILAHHGPGKEIVGVGDTPVHGEVVSQVMKSTGAKTESKSMMVTAEGNSSQSSMARTIGRT